MKLYSYETPLYGALNQANQWQDKDKVKSLGPFALLLHMTLREPAEKNMEVQAKRHGVKEFEDRITLYRGLGLPVKALETYREYQANGNWFSFTGFTSTSCEEDKALEFAYRYGTAPGNVPVLFVMEAEHGYGGDNAYLHDNNVSAFPKEQEYLLGYAAWKVTAVKPDIEKDFGLGPFTVTEIHLKQHW